MGLAVFIAHISTLQTPSAAPGSAISPSIELVCNRFVDDKSQYKRMTVDPEAVAHSQVLHLRQYRARQSQNMWSHRPAPHPCHAISVTSIDNSEKGFLHDNRERT